ncbi:hypothetical protein NL404_27215, partial [Klebsiella pneumoniae]|nr:hypothetical protein [Klebsiella pneumoniae]
RANPKISDNGTTVLTAGERLYTLTYDLTALSVEGFTVIGDRPAITDSGEATYVAFYGEHQSYGKGIYVAPAADPSKWVKVAGVSGPQDMY